MPKITAVVSQNDRYIIISKKRLFSTKNLSKMTVIEPKFEETVISALK